MILSGLLCLWLAACGGGGGGGSAAAAGAGDTASGLSAAGSSGAAMSPAATPAAIPAAIPATPAAMPAATPESDEMSFSFTLPAARTTSAGVYAADGRLVRTLWRGERLPAGTVTRSWNQRRDDNSVAAAGNYTVRLVHHDIEYRWDGVVGNTSAASGNLPHRAFLPPAALALHGDQMHFGSGYNEAQSSIHGFRVGQPQLAVSRVRQVDPFVGVGLLATDGQRLYAANTGGLSRTGFVFAFDANSGARATFSEGQSLCLNRVAGSTRCYADQDYPSVIAVRADGETLPTGLAVQTAGPVLAVAYGAEQRVRLFNKTSGRLLREMSVPLSPHSRNQLAISADGDLWVIGAQSLRRYTALTGEPRLTLEINDLERPLAAAGDPADAHGVWVADGGINQQLRRFGRYGMVTAAIGLPGGMDGSAAVSDDRFCFAAEAGRENSAVAVDAQGRPWAVDTCNNRLLHFDASGRVLARMAYLPHMYTATTDSARPERVFAGFMEFAVDYSRPLNDAGAWRLVRNWLPALPAALRDSLSANLGFGGLRSVQTLRNGRSYAMLQVGNRQAVAELGVDGRFGEPLWLAQPTAQQSGYVLHANGELGYAVDVGGQQRVYRLALLGFNSSGVPSWSNQPRLLAAAPTDATAPWHRHGTFTGVLPARFPQTSDGKVVFFNAGVDGADGFHLGAVAQGGSQWSWQASRSGPLDYRGSFQTKTSDNRIQYGGNIALTSGRDIVYGYHGEFYTDLGNGRIGQANQFMHFLDNGLFVGQFGVPSTRDGPAVVAGRGGNSFSPSLVRVGNRLFLYHNDESTWGGVHRWELRGADGIGELSASGALGSRIDLR